MTSVLRKYSQIDPRLAYYLVLGNDISGLPMPMWRTITNGTTSTLMSVSEFTSNLIEDTASPISPKVGDLLKDLGRQITVYDPTVPGYPHIALFRQVLYIDQSLTTQTEGIGTTITFYICVWAQESISLSVQFKPHYVVRTG